MITLYVNDNIDNNDNIDHISLETDSRLDKKFTR